MGMTRRSFFASLLAALGLVVWPPVPGGDGRGVVDTTRGPDYPDDSLHQQVFS